MIIGLGVAVTLFGVLIAAWAWRERGGRQVERAAITSSSIVMLGDSITEEGPWSSIESDRAVVNRGYSGFTTGQLVEIAREVAAARPAAVFVLTGTNDIRDGRSPSWTVERLALILDEFERAAPDSEIVIQTVLPRSDRVDEVLATNSAIRDLAVDRGITLLDLYSPFDDGTGGLRDADTVDGLHLSDDGNRRWAELLVEPFSRV